MTWPIFDSVIPRLPCYGITATPNRLMWCSNELLGSKGKSASLHCMKAYWEVQARLYSSVTSHCMQVSIYTSWRIFHPGEKPPTVFNMRVGGRLGEEKISCP